MAVARDRGPFSPYIYFFYDSEGSGGSAMRDWMVEVAVAVYTGNLPLPPQARDKMADEYFTSLCHCEQDIELEVWQKHGLDAQALRGQPTVHMVLTGLLDWVQAKVREIEETTAKQYTAVLVAHGGNAFDFPLLVTEVKRNRLEERFTRLQLQFADTVSLCEQLRAHSDPALQGSKKLSLTHLHSLFFPTEEYKAHRALGDALTLRKVFTETLLLQHLPTVELVSTEQLIQKWHSYMDSQQLVQRLGLHKGKAKEMVRKGVTLEWLERGYRDSGCSEHWLRGQLRSLGVWKPGHISLAHFRDLSTTHTTSS